MISYAQISIRILAIYVLANSVNSAYSHLYLRSINFYDGDAVYFLVAGSLVIAIVLSALMWFLAPKLAGKLVAGHDAQPISESGIVSAGSFVIGLYWFMKSLLMAITSYAGEQHLNIGALVLLFISVLIILGNKIVSDLYNRLRR